MTSSFSFLLHQQQLKLRATEFLNPIIVPEETLRHFPVKDSENTVQTQGLEKRKENFSGNEKREKKKKRQ